MRVIYEITQVDLRLAHLLTQNYANVCHYLHFLLLFCESIFSSDGFLSTTHKLTPHIKGEKFKKKKKKKKKKKQLYILQHETHVHPTKERKEKEGEEGSTADPRCCGAEPTHGRPGFGRPPTLRPATPPIPTGQTQLWVWCDPRSSSPTDLGPFKVNFQNLDFSFKSKNDFVGIRIEF
jgi:hypothetical protein